jgi:hypothetical protein
MIIGSKLFSDVKINTSDSKLTRRSKRSFKRNLKSKFKLKQKQKKIADKEKNKWIGIGKPTRNYRNSNSFLKYSFDIEKFCAFNKGKSFKKKSFLSLEKDFDLHVNPQSVLDSLLTIISNARRNNLSLEVKYNGDVSFGALYLLDNICWEIASKKSKWKLNAKNISERNFQIQSRLRSFETGKVTIGDGFIYNNKIKINREDNDLATQDHKRASKTVRDLINKCLSEQNTDLKLNKQQVKAIDSAISEHFDNILLHVPSAKHGNLCTFYDRTRRSITILIYNYGHSIADSLTKGNVPFHVQNEIDSIIEIHKSKKVLGLINGFTEENALTLLAIQEGISSKLSIDNSRGYGIMDFIGHCKDMCKESYMTIISGGTAIKIDSNTIPETAFVLGRKRRVIAFNEKNDLFEKPSKNNVVNMNVYFPGVIIETVIPIDNII